METINDNINNPDEVIEEVLEPQPHGGSLVRTKKVDIAGVGYYGPSFDGYQKVEEYRDLIPAFKDHYYQAKIANPECTITGICKSFNKFLIDTGVNRKFHPYTTQIRNWKKKWDRDILERMGKKDQMITTQKKVFQVLKTRNDENSIGEYVAPTHESLEGGLQTLGGELLNDALQIMRDDQDLEDMYSSDELMKRKTYVTNVFANVTKMVHGKAALMLKASQEKRENAGFIMDMLKKATSGEMSAEEIEQLKQQYTDVTPKENVITSS